MKILKDIVSGDELASDAYPCEEEDDCVFKITTKLITKAADGYQYDEPDAQTDVSSDAVTVNNLVDAHRLVETTFTKKSYMVYIKGYLQALRAHLREHNPERTKAFMKAAQVFVGKVSKDFRDYQFFTGESMNPDGMVVLMKYSEDGQTPYVYIFKDGVEEVKY
eukprot:CAMPEP_0174251106 /NCGR_PEP_ID=MMETSP0439-20130205/1041_1 /TAXON_ID=0 /ORGANISM="Stereomyxa ramosa, Strain Chinc5" /LENGTH=163 /DNA_ID=CAMNT_0015331341 /DNA_START=62 /DNA_END=553 /DNA_ORIENTATION=-